MPYQRGSALALTRARARRGAARRTAHGEAGTSATPGTDRFGASAGGKTGTGGKTDAGTAGAGGSGSGGKSDAGEQDAAMPTDAGEMGETGTPPLDGGKD